MSGAGSGDESPDGPRLGLDEDLAAAAERAHPTLAQRRLHALLRANRFIIADLDLERVLERVVEAAREVAGADYAALGVRRPDGDGLERLVHEGVDEETAAAIGRSPEGHGVLGALIDDPQPLRVADVSEHPRFAGFPEHHPSMCAFMGVPVRVRNGVFGDLYLARREGGDAFTEDDEELVHAVAATAGVAIENACMFEESCKRQDWLATSTEVTRTLLASPVEEPLQLLAEHLHRLAGALFVVVVEPVHDGSQMRITAAAGFRAEQLVGTERPLIRTMTERVLEAGEAIRSPKLVTTEYDDLVPAPAGRLTVGPSIAVPLMGAAGARAVLWLVRATGEGLFSPDDESLVATFVDQASTAWQLAEARSAHHQVALVDDRMRIARDLHDHVIQRLFAAGLTLYSLAPRGTEIGAHIDRVVDELDSAIRQIRSSIFELRPASGGLRAATLDVLREVRAGLGVDPHVVFDGPVDTHATEDLVNDVAAVVREALTNVAKHSGATAADVVVRAAGDEIEVRISDNGRGLGRPDRFSGLGNMRARAEARSGSLVLGANPGGKGTSVEWRVPVPRANGSTPEGPATQEP